MNEQRNQGDFMTKILPKLGAAFIGYVLVTLFGGLVGITIAVFIYLGYRWFNNQNQ